MHTITTQMWLTGIRWEVEIHFDYQPEERDTGIPEGIELEQVWLLGYYPEDSAKRGDYVGTNIKCDLRELTPADLSDFEEVVWRSRQ
jgi:hypothetical protein